MTFDRDRVASALPNYEVGEEIGRGAWSVVRAGTHIPLGLPVAIKQIPEQLASVSGVRRRFSSEARLLASLDHPHIVRVVDYVEQDGLCLLVMELLNNGTLWEHFEDHSINVDEVCAIGLAMCTALQVAHNMGILHRDVKPQNVMFNANGFLKVTDFGIAKMLGGAETVLTGSGDVIGTPAYMSPEQATSKELTPATDVYAIGVMLYELLSRQLPFSDAGGTLEILYRHVYEDPRPLSDVAPDTPASFVGVVMRAIARNPVERFSSAEELGVALATAARSHWGPEWLSSTGLEIVPSLRIAQSAQKRNGVVSVEPYVEAKVARSHFSRWPEGANVSSWLENPDPTAHRSLEGGVSGATIIADDSEPLDSSAPLTYGTRRRKARIGGYAQDKRSHMKVSGERVSVASAIWVVLAGIALVELLVGDARASVFVSFGELVCVVAYAGARFGRMAWSRFR